MFKIDPLRRRQLAAALVLIGFVLIVATVVFGVGHYFRRSSAIADAQGRAEACEVNLRLTKGNVKKSGENEISVTWEGLENSIPMLGTASAAASMCPGWSMQEFCMGNACTFKGTSLTLRKN